VKREKSSYHNMSKIQLITYLCHRFDALKGNAVNLRLASNVEW